MCMPPFYTLVQSKTLCQCSGQEKFTTRAEPRLDTLNAVEAKWLLGDCVLIVMQMLIVLNIHSCLLHREHATGLLLMTQAHMLLSYTWVYGKVLR